MNDAEIDRCIDAVLLAGGYDRVWKWLEKANAMREAFRKAIPKPVDVAEIVTAYEAGMQSKDCINQYAPRTQQHEAFVYGVEHRSALNQMVAAVLPIDPKPQPVVRERCEECRGEFSHYRLGCPLCSAVTCCETCCRKTYLSTKIGRWLSAALEDDSVCGEMKADIRAWFDAGCPAEQHDIMVNVTGGDVYQLPVSKSPVYPKEPRFCVTVPAILSATDTEGRKDE